MTPIREFTVDEANFRLALDTTDDAVFLQQYVYGEGDEPHPNWLNLLCFDRNGKCTDADGNKVGNFRMEGSPPDRNWVFYERPIQTRIQCSRYLTAESLIDSEVTISKRWIAARTAAREKAVQQ